VLYAPFPFSSLTFFLVSFDFCAIARKRPTDLFMADPGSPNQTRTPAGTSGSPVHGLPSPNPPRLPNRLLQAFHHAQLHERCIGEQRVRIETQRRALEQVRADAGWQLEKQRQDYERELAKVKTIADARLEELYARDQEVAKLTSALGSPRTCCADAERRLLTLREALEDMSKQLEACSSGSERLVAQAQELKEQLTGETRRAASAAASRTETAQQLKEKKAEVDCVRKQLETTKRLLQCSEARAETLDSELSSAKGRLRDGAAATAGLSDDLRQLRFSKADAEARLQASSDRNTTLQRVKDENKELKAQLHEYGKQLRDVDAAEAKCTANTNAYELARQQPDSPTATKLRAQLKQCLQENKDLHQRNAETTCKLNEERSRTQQLIQDMDRLQQQGQPPPPVTSPLRPPTTPSTAQRDVTSSDSVETVSPVPFSSPNTPPDQRRDPRLAKRRVGSEESEDRSPRAVKKPRV